MGREIERKYLVNHKKWKQVVKSQGKHYRQGYLISDPEKTIRIRVAGEKGFLTIKGITVGASRSEYEYSIPLNDAKELLDQFSTSELSKTRYTLDFEGKAWEIDEFLGDNEGLIVAEIELEMEDEKFNIPDWIDKEVTGQEKYYNSSLATTPYKSWKL